MQTHGAGYMHADGAAADCIAKQVRAIPALPSFPGTLCNPPASQNPKGEYCQPCAARVATKCSALVFSHLGLIDSQVAVID